MMQFVCTSGCGIPVIRNPDRIIVHGAREHNLKNICFEIPKGKLVALTGLSGSGKSSIATDVLRKECLRQYLESLGMTTDHITKAKVDNIIGLSPAIGVSQRMTDFNPRSTVGTKTGILTILRNLFASIGHQLCIGCGKTVGQPLRDKNTLKTIEMEEEERGSSKKKAKSFFDCPNCRHPLEKLKMSDFSFNASTGACEACKGVGHLIRIDISNLLNEEKTIGNGGVNVWDPAVAKHYEGVIQAASKHYNFPFDTEISIRNYTTAQKNFLLYGITYPDFVKAHKNIKEPKKVSEGKFEGIVPYLLNRYKSHPNKVPQAIKKYILHEPCLECHHTCLGKIGRETTVSGKTIIDVAGLNLCGLLKWINELDQHVSEDESQVLAVLSSALKERTSHLIDVGLDYLSLDRTLPTLSAGESQRLKLACVIGSTLTGVLYVFDEPTTGLHPHDTAKLIKTLRMIQEAGNTVLVIEHDLDVIENVDYIIDVGPGGGSKGGKIVVSGTPAEVMACPTSITGKYLARKATIKLDIPRPNERKLLTIHGASEHNLKGIDVSIPVNQLVVMTGVSGSGKSTFLFDILDKVARKHFNHTSIVPGKYVSVDGLNHFNRVVTIDQITIRKTQSSRSNVATYTKLFDLIRDLFASLQEAKVRGFTAEKFSFNISEERCENCNGAGVVGVDMTFMPDVEMICSVCNGMRFTEELLSVKFKGHNIADVLEMTVSDAISIFREQQNISVLLDLMKQVGLEYLTLGQSTSTLSGGESQRIKLATELSKSGRESTLYLLDEPTTGLHAEEVEKLLNILRRLVSKGNTVIAIEHNLEAMFQADTIIDFGPGGGIDGGEIVATGSPQEVAANKNSLTGQCLKAYLLENQKSI